jgi:transposase
MSNVPLFVGVDYHQDQLQVCVIDQAERVRFNRACPNDVAHVARLLHGFGNGNVRAVAIEACCGAAAFGEALAPLGGWRVELAHAGYVARLRQSPDKSDFDDGRLLADLTRVGYLPRVWLAPPGVRDLRQLVNHRQRLVDRRRDAKLQAGAVLREQRVKIDGGSRWSRAWVARVRDNDRLSDAARWIANDLLDEIDHLSAKVAAAERRLREATAGDALVARLRTIEGVGEVTAWTLAAWVGRFDRFATGKQLSRYCGLSPRNASSGNRRADAGLIDAANRRLRAVLIQAGHRLVRTDGRWGALAARMLARGKPKNVVVAAVANRWVRSMHHRMIARPAATVAPGGREGERGGATTTTTTMTMTA